MVDMKRTRQRLMAAPEGTQLSAVQLQQALDDSTVSGTWKEDRLVRKAAPSGSCSIEEVKCVLLCLCLPLASRPRDS